MKEIEIQGCVTVPEEILIDDFMNQFIAFVESNCWDFGGGCRIIIDGYSMNVDGTKVKYILDT